MKIIGHRGARGLAAENTIESIKAALGAGVDGIELDARVTHDGVIVLSHDPYINDTAQHHWVLKQHSYTFLKQRIPGLTTLDEALEVIPKNIEIRLEIKPVESIEPFIDFFTEIQDRNITVVSFDMKLLLTLYATMPNLQLGINERWSSTRAQYYARRLHTSTLQMNQRWLWRGFLKVMKRAGYAITPYTINSLSQAKRWEKYIDAIITDYPDRFHTT